MKAISKNQKRQLVTTHPSKYNEQKYKLQGKHIYYLYIQGIPPKLTQNYIFRVDRDNQAYLFFFFNSRG